MYRRSRKQRRRNVYNVGTEDFFLMKNTRKGFSFFRIETLLVFKY